jgi:hypothetical protein
VPDQGQAGDLSDQVSAYKIEGRLEVTLLTANLQGRGLENLSPWVVVQFGDEGKFLFVPQNKKILERKTEISVDRGAGQVWTGQNFSFERKEVEYMVLKVMGGDGEGALLGEVRLLVDNYTTHCHQELSDRVNLTKDGESAGTLGVRLEWWPSDEQFNNDFDDLSAPEFE